jgi:hypothetical protein
MERRQKLTIITESALESVLPAELERLGAKGYTILAAHGKGARGVRTGDWDQNRNIQIDVICNESVANAIVAHCTERYYKHYAMVLYLTDVGVVRPEKF